MKTDKSLPTFPHVWRVNARGNRRTDRFLRAFFFFKVKAAALETCEQLSSVSECEWRRRSDEEEYLCCADAPLRDCYLGGAYIRPRRAHLFPLNATWQLPLVSPLPIQIRLQSWSAMRSWGDVGRYELNCQ